MLDIGPLEFVLLAILAVVLFGPEKLPEFFRKAARVLHYVRGIANEATGQLRRELGPEYDDLKLRDLNPKDFVRRHLLEGVEPVVADVKDDINSVRQLAQTESDTVREALDVDGNGAASTAAAAGDSGAAGTAVDPAAAATASVLSRATPRTSTRQTVGGALMGLQPEDTDDEPVENTTEHGTVTIDQRAGGAEVYPSRVDASDVPVDAGYAPYDPEAT